MRAALAITLIASIAQGCAGGLERGGAQAEGERTGVASRDGADTSQTESRAFPLPANALSGRRVLLIVIPMTAPNTAHFFAGTARWTGAALEVRHGDSAVPVVAQGSDQALRAFNPKVLRNLIEPELYPPVAALAAGVEACVAVFAPEPPAGGLALEAPFFGVASGAGGEVLLMQGDPDDG